MNINKFSLRHFRTQTPRAIVARLGGQATPALWPWSTMAAAPEIGKFGGHFKWD